MRHAISWSDLVGREVGIWGLGVDGRASLRKLRALGVEPVIVDDDPPADATEAILRTDEGGLEALAACPVVIKAPGISRYRTEVDELERGGTAVVGGLGLWFEEAHPAKVVAVTGTKGKSTTTSILTHLARGLGVRAVAAGNLGTPPFDPEGPVHPDLWVVEVSSYQATDVASSPELVVVTSLFPDHLPWHGGVEEYYRDKLSLTSQPGAALTIAPATSAELRDREALLGPHVRWVDDDPDVESWAAPLGLRGRHNLMNASLARAALEALGIDGADDVDALRAAAEGFEGLPSRLEPAGEIGGVTFIDDCLSTNVLPALAAVEAFPDRRVALIAGGQDRGVDYRPLAEGLRARTRPTLVLTTYETGPRMQAAIEQVAPPLVEAAPAEGLREAVVEAYRWARPDGVVLLSPAAPSFDQFADYKAKAAAFRAAIAELTAT